MQHHIIFNPIRTAAFVPNQYCQMMEEVEIQLKAGTDVTYIYCDGKAIHHCQYNCFGDNSVCKHCQRYRKYLFRHLSKSPNLHLVSLSNFKDALDDYSFIEKLDYNSTDDIKRISYKGVMIGYAALSNYLSETRNLFPLVDNEFRLFFNNWLLAAAQLTDLVLNILTNLPHDCVQLFNSRLICCRPIVDLCKQNQWHFISHEIGYNTYNQQVKKYFVNNTPHDISTITKMINELWDNSKLPDNEKEKVAKAFFEKRRNAISSGDKIYVAGQQKGLLPEDWKEDTHNIAIFNSSEDEFAALGDEFTSLSLFPSQYDGLKYIFNKYKNNKKIHFYLRIHPNLKDIPYAYHKKLYDFSNLPNVSVIPGNSPISTYTLMDKADTILVFGSTTGAEAVYANKPVILLGCATYRNLNICHIPSTIEELDKMIEDQKLQIKDAQGALKMGYFAMNDEFPCFQYFTDHKKASKSIFGKKFIVTYLKLKGSAVSQYIGIVYQIFGKYVYLKSKHELPTKEMPL